MGAISFTLDRSLARELQGHLHCAIFVETGTFRGDSLEIAEALFPRCVSIELSPEYHAAAQQRFIHATHVEVLLGDSPDILRAHQPVLTTQSTLFWLDAHWCAAENSAGEKSQCPLLAELGSIETLHPNSAVLIDDARLFLTAPPAPHDASDWPDLDSVLSALKRLSADHAVTCFNDVILFLPRAVMAAMHPYFHRHGFNLLSYADKARRYDTLLEQTKIKEVELLTLAETAREREQSLIRSNSEADRLRDATAKLTTDLIAKETALLAAHTEREQMAAISKERALALTQSNAEADRLRAEAAQRLQLNEQLIEKLRRFETSLVEIQNQNQQLHEHLGAKEAVIHDLSRTCEERLRLINRLALKGDEPVIGATRILTYHGSSFLSRFRRTCTKRFNAWLTKQTPYQLGQLVQYQPQPMQIERFPSKRPPADWPRICLITPSYNQAHFLERTMRSVLDQKYPNLAYGVQDGGSTDASARIIDQHINELTHAESAQDNGQADAIVKGFSKLYPSTHDIMGWLNSDDTLMPGSLAYVGRFFANHPEVDVIYGHRVIIDENDREIGRWFLPKHHVNTLLWFDLVPQETLFWRSRSYEQIGGLDPSFHFAMDWDLLLKFEESGCNLRRLPYFLGCFRLHSMQKTSAKIHTLGEAEMKRLRHRVHGREIQGWEIHQQLAAEVGRSAHVAWLAQNGIRL
jgi:Glycosyl transferase family 2